MLILSRPMNNIMFDQFSIFLLVFFITKPIKNSIECMCWVVRGIRANPVSLVARGTTMWLMVYIILKFSSSKLWDGLARPTFFRRCRLICSDKGGPTMYTNCHQML